MTFVSNCEASMYIMQFFFHGLYKAEAAGTVMGLMGALMGVKFLCFGENFVQKKKKKGNECFNKWGSIANYYTLQNC